MMKLENVDKYYNINTSSEVHALKNINLSIINTIKSLAFLLDFFDSLH